MQVLSPELALVDGALRSAAREALPTRLDVFTALERRRAGDPIRRARIDAIRAGQRAATTETAGNRWLRWGLVGAIMACAVAEISGAVTLGGPERPSAPQGADRVGNVMQQPLGTQMRMHHPDARAATAAGG